MIPARPEKQTTKLRSHGRVGSCLESKHSGYGSTLKSLSDYKLIHNMSNIGEEGPKETRRSCKMELCSRKNGVPQSTISVPRQNSQIQDSDSPITRTNKPMTTTNVPKGLVNFCICEPPPGSSWGAPDRDIAIEKSCTSAKGINGLGPPAGASAKC